MYTNKTNVEGSIALIWVFCALETKFLSFCGPVYFSIIGRIMEHQLDKADTKNPAIEFVQLLPSFCALEGSWPLQRQQRSILGFMQRMKRSSALTTFVTRRQWVKSSCRPCNGALGYDYDFNKMYEQVQVYEYYWHCHYNNASQ